MTVLAAMREGKARWIVESRRCAVDDFGNEGQRLQRPRAELLEEEQRRKIAQVALVRECEDGAKPTLIDIPRTYVVARRHLEATDIGERPGRVGTCDGQECLLCRPRSPIDKIPDRARMRAHDGGVGVGREVA